MKHPVVRGGGYQNDDSADIGGGEVIKKITGADGGGGVPGMVKYCLCNI